MVVVRKLVGQHPTERIAWWEIDEWFSANCQLVNLYKLRRQEWQGSNRALVLTSNPLQTQSHLALASRGKSDLWAIPGPPIISHLASADRRD